jgi:hypothetical protein
MKFKFLHVGLILSISILANTASAGIIFYTNDPSNNSVNWNSATLADGYQINDNLNFDSHGLGTLDSNFYLGSDNVTIASSNANNQTIKNGAGDIDGNTAGSIPGEGVHQSSNWLDINSNGQLTLSFLNSAFAAGISSFDNFTSGYFDISVFSGINGTGNNLGTVSGIAQGLNFQNLGTFFMGVKTDDGSTFGSIVYSFDANGSRDTIGYDDIVFSDSRATDSTPVPEPTTLAIFALGMMGLASRRFKKQS